jgi:hypothetical protein
MKGTAPGRGQVLALAAVVVLVVTAVLFGARGSEEVPEPTAAPTPAPEPPPRPPAEPAPPIDPEPNAGQLLLQERYGFDDPEALGVRVDSADVPVDAAIDPDYDRLEDEAAPWRWPARFVTPPSAPIDGEPFVEDVLVEREPAPCYAFHRRVRGVDVGIGGAVGRRMEAVLLARLPPHAYAGFDGSTSGAWWEDHCAGPPGARGEFFVSDQVIRVPCELPGREVRCFSVTRWWTDGAMVPPWEAHHLVLDRASGERLVGAALHPGLAEDEFTLLLRLVLYAVTGFDVPEDVLDSDVSGIEYGVTAPPTLVPMTDGVAVEWLGSEDHKYALYGSRIVIPWEVIDRAAAATS